MFVFHYLLMVEHKNINLLLNDSVGQNTLETTKVTILVHSGAERSPGQTKYIIGGSYIVGNVYAVRFRNS